MWAQSWKGLHYCTTKYFLGSEIGNYLAVLPILSLIYIDSFSDHYILSNSSKIRIQEIAFSSFFLSFLYWVSREGEKHRFVVPLTCAFIGCLVVLFYVPWAEIKPTTLAYWDNTLTNWAIWPVLNSLISTFLVICLRLASSRVLLLRVF